MNRTEEIDLLLDWRESLFAQRLDLVGDFAGKELFAIHGDALLLYCTAKAEVDYTQGFQLLHAIHAVETLLANLKQRGCNFHLVWFRDDEPFCVPRSASKTRSCFYRLTRAVMIQHFLPRYQISSSAGESIQLEFDSLDCAEAKSYLASYAYYFWLCLDGIEFDECSVTSKIFYLGFMSEVANLGYSIASINDLAFISSKVHASVSSPSRVECRRPERLMSPLPMIGYDTIENLEGKQPALIRRSSKWLLWPNQAPFTAREKVTLIAISNLMLTDACPGTKKLAAAITLQLSALRRSSLAQRSCKAVVLSTVQENLLDIFLCSFAEVCISIIKDSDFTDDRSWDIFDLFDGRIARWVVKNFSSLHLPADVVAETQGFCQKVEHLAGVQGVEIIISDLDASHAELTISNAAQNNAVDEQSHPMMPFADTIFDEYLKQVRVDTTALPTMKSRANKVFMDLTHWHSPNILVSEKLAPTKQTPRERKRAQKFKAETIVYSASLTNSCGKIIDPEIIVTSTCVLPKSPGRDRQGAQKGTGKETESKNKCSAAASKGRKGKKGITRDGTALALEAAKRVKDKKLQNQNASAMNM